MSDEILGSPLAFTPYGLIFEGMGKHRVQGWNGEWPPPEVLWVCTGELAGGVAFAEPDRIKTEVLEEMLGSSISIRVFTRRSYSTIPPGEMSHVWPCAQYVEEGLDYDGGHFIESEENE